MYFMKFLLCKFIITIQSGQQGRGWTAQKKLRLHSGVSQSDRREGVPVLPPMGAVFADGEWDRGTGPRAANSSPHLLYTYAQMNLEGIH